MPSMHLGWEVSGGIRWQAWAGAAFNLFLVHGLFAFLPMNFPMWSRRALALRVTTQVSRWGKVALNVLPVLVPSLSL